MGDRIRQVHRLLVRATGPMTVLGRTVLVCGVVAWVGGVALGWDELLIVAGACLVALAVAAVFTLGRTELRVETSLTPPRVTVGERAVGELTVTNIGRHRMLPLRLELPVGRSFASIDVPPLAAGHEFSEVVVVPTSRRSVIPVGPTRSVRGDPLGLMRREVTWTDELELFVHPITSRLAGLASGWMRDLEGRPTNDRSPSDVAFHTLREYVPGDDRRHIHWRTSARIDQLMVREFVDNRRSHLGIVIDTDPSDYADVDEFELAMSMAGSLGVRAILDGQETSCVAGGLGVPSHTGPALLDGLARVELGGSEIDVRQAVARGAPLVRAASVIVLVTGSGLEIANARLAAQRFGAEPRLLCVRAARDAEPGRIRAAQMSVLTSPSLDTFARLMWSVANR